MKESLYKESLAEFQHGAKYKINSPLIISGRGRSSEIESSKK
jgi:hypothetical protein